MLLLQASYCLVQYVASAKHTCSVRVKGAQSSDALSREHPLTIAAFAFSFIFFREWNRCFSILNLLLRTIN